MPSFHTENNLRVFRRFLEIADIPIKANSIEAKPPSHPDIVAESVNGEQVAFELTEILDEELARRDRRQITLDNSIKANVENLTKREKTAFNTQFDNALLGLDFKDVATDAKIKKTLPRIFKMLLGLDRNFIGEIETHELGDLGDVLDCIQVSRGKFQGPIIDVANYGFVNTPVMDAIKRKLGKAYVTTLPIELMCYCEHILMRINPKVLLSSLESLDSIDPFRRIWVVDLKDVSVLLQYP